MIVTNEFIWHKDHFVCHITDEKNIDNIIEKGLIPLNGERCKTIGDDRTGIFCLDGLYSVSDWAEVLYENGDIETLKLLRINLKMRKWYMDMSNDNAFGLYLPNKVLPQSIDYLQLKDINGKIVSLEKLFDIDFLERVYDITGSFDGIGRSKKIIVDGCSLSWEPIEQYYKNNIMLKRG